MGANISRQQVPSQIRRSASSQKGRLIYATVSVTVHSILTWLGPSDYQESLRRATTKRVPGTGEWLVERPELSHWLGDQQQNHFSRLLWIYGAPGVGKSVLCGTIVEHIQKLNKKENAGGKMTYFYCDSSTPTKRTTFDICTSLLLQLQLQHQEPSNTLQAAYHNAALHGRSYVSDADEISSLFCRTIAELSCSHIVIDALDECADIPTLIDCLWSATSSTPSLRVLIFSRDIVEIRKRLTQIPSIHLTAESMKPDIEAFLSKSMDFLPCDSQPMKAHIFDILSTQADGMFLFAALAFQTLQQATNIDDTLELLASTPGGVYDMYGLILKRLSTETDRRRSLARKALRLLCTSTRPLTWPEFRVALSWDMDQQHFRPTSAPFKDTILALCCPLIEYRAETDTFRPVHLSLYEYLCNGDLRPQLPQDVAQFMVNIPYAQSELARMTLAQIADPNVSRSISVNGSGYPFVEYATKSWCHHLSLSLFDTGLCGQYSKFTACPDRRSIWILRWLLSEDSSFPLQQIVRLQHTVREWLPKGNSPTVSSADTLSDIQQALFRLDELPQTMPGLRVISNFERLICLRDLAREFTSAGKLDDGVQMFEDALLRTGAEDQSIDLRSCWLLNSLGILYDQQGDASRAKKTQQRALACQEHKLPPDHLDIVLTVNELGRIARHLGDYEEAESLHRRALATLASLFEETDFHVTWTKSALGRSLLKQGRPSEALPLHEQVMSVETERLGKDHPHTLWTMSDIVRCFRDLGRLERAIDLQQEIVDRSTCTLGPRNPDTLWAMNSLGLLYEAAENHEMARRIQASAYEGQTATLGESHSHCLWTRDVLDRL